MYSCVYGHGFGCIYVCLCVCVCVRVSVRVKASDQHQVSSVALHLIFLRQGLTR